MGRLRRLTCRDCLELFIPDHRNRNKEHCCCKASLQKKQVKPSARRNGKRYLKGAILITSNRSYKDWLAIFSKEMTLTSAMMDRLLNHADTVVIEGKSYRMKERAEIKQEG